MGKRLTFKIGYGSHIPVLVKLLSITTGPVLELGSGYFSTPVLHYLCSAQHRQLVTYENEPIIYDYMHQCENKYHKVILVNGWDDCDIECPWDVALIDHAPAERRIVDVMRLSNWAKYIVCHDTSWKQDKHYHYKTIFPEFKYAFHYAEFNPGNTSVLSNLVDLNELSI